MGPVDKVNSAMNWTTFTVWWKEKHNFIFGRYHAQLLWFSQFDLLYIFPPLQFDKRRWFDIFWPCIRMCSPSFPTQRVSILAQRSRPTLHCTLLSHPSQQLNKSKENLRLPGFLELPCWLVPSIPISVTHFHLSCRRCGSRVHFEKYSLEKLSLEKYSLEKYSLEKYSLEKYSLEKKILVNK